jgi:Fic family protein
MKRGLTGHLERVRTAGESFEAFVPSPLPPVPALAIDADLQERLDQAHVALGRLDSVTTLLPEKSIFLYSYVRKEAVLSSQIEGTQSTLNDLLLFEAQAAPGVPLDDVREVSRYVDALEQGMVRIRERFPLSTRLFNEMHGLLLAQGRGAGKVPGEYRRSQNWIGGARPSKAAYVPPPHTQVNQLMGALENFLNDVPVRHPPLIKAALAHVQFETIHPYLDGNGRLGRLLVPLIFVREGMLAEPLLYVSLYIKRHRETYYKLLQQVREEGDWEEWLRFFAVAVESAARQAVASVHALNGLGSSDRARIRELGRIAPSCLQVYEAMFARPVARIGHIAAITRQSNNTIVRMLEHLQKLGIVEEVTGNKRNRVYRYPAYLDILGREED